MPQGTTYKETLILHNAGVPLGEMAQIKGVSVETIKGHIARLIDEDMITNFASYISRSEYETINDLYRTNPEGAAKILSEDYPGGTIRIARAIYNYNQRRKQDNG
ncbi:MAG: helix-turn-helix domain-containing protein [Bacteroidales bacterium]|nr:helix-turn-helix domain-containing protein [Bacteroidales bacterium]